MPNPIEADFMFDHQAPLPKQAEVKARWGPGPWQDEPDRVQFHAHDLPCLLLRGPFGGWNGYVALPYDHPWYGANEYDMPVEVHGGITYSALEDAESIMAWQGDEASADPVCDPPWWVGFDCAHAWDIQPGMEAFLVALMGGAHTSRATQEYRTLDFARRATEFLAQQIQEAKGGDSLD